MNHARKKDAAEERFPFSSSTSPSPERRRPVMSRERVTRRQKDISRLLREKKRLVPDKARKSRKKKSGS